MALETKSLQEELQAVQFSQDSKAGRMLMAKCRALQVRISQGQNTRSPFGQNMHAFVGTACMDPDHLLC